MAESPTSTQMNHMFARMQGRDVKALVKKESPMGIERRGSADRHEHLNTVNIAPKPEEDRENFVEGNSERMEHIALPRLAAPEPPRHNVELPSYDEAEYLKEQSKPFEIEFNLHGTHNTSKFVQRPSKMKQLEKYILENRHRQSFVALWGFGGFGKTQIATAFAKAHHKDFSAIFFINAENQETLDQSLAFHLSRIWKKWPERLAKPQIKPENSESVRLAFLEWLRIRQNNNWLLIFDSVDYLPSEHETLPIKKYYPETDHGAIIVTTRRREYEKEEYGIEIDRMTEEEASELLRRSQSEDHEHQNNATERAESFNELDPGKKNGHLV